MKGKKRSLLWHWQEHARNNDVKCASCHRSGYCTVDHIVPLSLLAALGLKDMSIDDEWNFQYLCRACNMRKGFKLDYTDPKTLENLKRYVRLAEETYGHHEQKENH